MITCKECIHWNTEKEPNYHLPSVNYNDCKLDGDKFLYDPYTDEECKSDSLIYWDKSSYSASFQTGPDFGCIHGKKKD